MNYERMFDLHRKEFFDLHKMAEEKFRNKARHQNLVLLVGYCAESSWEAVYVQGSGYYVFAEIPARLLCFDKYMCDEFSDLEWNTRCEKIRGICGGLKHVHDQCLIVHLDLKPENILMDATMIWCRRLRILVCRESMVASNPESSLKIVSERRDIRHQNT